jgi:hypothetical protein
MNRVLPVVASLALLSGPALCAEAGPAHSNAAVRPGQPIESPDGPLPAVRGAISERQIEVELPRRTSPRVSPELLDVPVDTMVLPPLYPEELETARMPGEPMVIGKLVEVDLHPAQRGTWIDLEGGDRVWIMSFQTLTADWLRVKIEPFRPLPDTELVVYDPEDLEQSYGSYGPADVRPGAFWSPTVFGRELRVEWYVPAGVARWATDDRFKISGAVQGFEGGRAAGCDARETMSGGGRGCRIDVNCHPGWDTAAQGVAHIWYQSGGHTYICSGTMVNRIGGDFARLFLTAAHCIGNEAEANSLEFYWFYQTDACSGTVPLLKDVPRTDWATLLGADPDPDISLVGITADLPGALTFLGWDSNPAPSGVDGYLLHHPCGEHKSISFGTWQGLDTGSCNSPVYTTSLLELSDGGQEGGSSGGPSLDAAQLVRGVASCSSAPDCDCDPDEDAWQGSLHHGWGKVQWFLAPSSTVYVNGAHAGPESGTVAEPWNTIIEGYFAVLGGGTIFIETGSYPPFSFDDHRAMTLRARNGTVVIGQ